MFARVIILFVLLFVGCNAPESKAFNPSGKIWFYEGTELPEVTMEFKQDGQIVFEDGFAWINPGRWEYDNDKKELTLIISNARDTDLKNLEGFIGKSNNIYNNPLSVDLKLKKVKYSFPSKINFLGLIFQEKIIKK